MMPEQEEWLAIHATLEIGLLHTGSRRVKGAGDISWGLRWEAGRWSREQQK